MQLQISSDDSHKIILAKRLAKKTQRKAVAVKSKTEHIIK